MIHIFDALRTGAELTGTERKIADYLLSHRQEAAKLSIGALAQATFTSNASIIRLCRKLGLSGYRELQILVSAEAGREGREEDGGNRVRSGTRTVRGAVPGTPGEAMEAAAEACRHTIPPEAVASAADWIAHADRVYLYAPDCFCAAAFAQALSACGVVCVVPGLGSRQTDGSPGDAALLAADSAEAAQAMLRAYTRGRAHRGRVILLTTETVESGADLTILVPRPAAALSPGLEGVFVHTAFFYLLNCLRYAVSQLRAPPGEA